MRKAAGRSASWAAARVRTGVQPDISAGSRPTASSKARAARSALLDQLTRNQDDVAFRTILELPLQGSLTTSDIKTAFRRLAKSAHPDAGGSSELYRRISEARAALLARLD
ncbi:MAG: hypothetical protein E6833_29365 [Bradyrhizobium sp.]|nr:hypothetical protein [Bradyrhizobium sp.]